MSRLNIVLFAVLIAVVSADVVDFERCNEGSDDICSISGVRITPSQKKRGVFRKLSNASLAFDFTPNFAANKLKTQVYWENGAVDLPFASQGSNDGCVYTSCPIEPGKQQTLDYNLYVDRKLPTGSFKIKWKLWDDELSESDNATKMCCFKTTIRIMKNKK